MDKPRYVIAGLVLAAGLSAAPSSAQAGLCTNEEIGYDLGARCRQVEQEANRQVVRGLETAGRAVYTVHSHARQVCHHMHPCLVPPAP